MPPEQFDNGWRLRVEQLADPNISSGVWSEDLETAIGMLADEIAKYYRPKN